MNRRLLTAATVACLLGVGCMGSTFEPSACSDDSQCGAGMLCWPEGCVDANRNLVIEVTANTSSGHHAQDFPVDTLSAAQNIEMFPPTSLVGDIQQRNMSVQNIDATKPYTYPVTVRAVGQSALIPGVLRRYEATFSSLERGAYSMFIGAGTYDVSAAAADTSIPVDARPAVGVSPGANSSVSFIFQGPDTAVPLAGLLVRSRAVPPIRETLVSAKMELQAFDPTTRKALSQRVPAGKDDGAFTLWVDPAVNSLDTFLVTATPSDPSSVVPTKTFVLTRPLPTQLVLEMGPYGQSLPGITGTVRGADGQPVAGATVLVEGTVGGGGTYRTHTVTTDEQGLFRLEAFLSPGDTTFVLTAIPPAGSPSGIFRGPVRVLTANVEGYLAPNSFTCPARIQLTGQLLLPDGLSTPAARVKVLAEPTASANGGMLPPLTYSTVTGDDGKFALYLDPADFRLDFLPDGDVPRRSRFISVRFDLDADGGVGAMALDPFTLANGRKVTGVVTSPQEKLISTSTSVPFAVVRYFHVTKVGGTPSSILLAESVSDEKGNYSIVLPDR